MKKVCCFSLLIAAIILMTGVVAVANCPDTKIVCAKIVNGTINNNSEVVGSFMKGQCWDWGCRLCPGVTEADLARQCTSGFPTACANNTCASCRGWADMGGIAGYCYDVNGTRLY